MAKKQTQIPDKPKDITVAIGRRRERSQEIPASKSTGFAREHKAARAGFTDPRLDVPSAKPTKVKVKKDKTPAAEVQTKVVTAPPKPAPKSTPAETKQPASPRTRATPAARTPRATQAKPAATVASEPATPAPAPSE